MNFVNRVALVTGGSGTLGWEITQELLHGSARVAVAARDEARFEQRLKTVPNLKRHLEFVESDLACPGEADRVVDLVRARLGGPHIVIHAAGVPPGPPRGLADMDAGVFRAAWEANVMTAFLVTRAALAAADGAEPLRIVHIGTRLDAVAGGPAVHVHVACRVAVSAMARGVARERARGGVRCNVVCPGLLDTRANRQAFPDIEADLWSKPGDVARAAVLLAAEETAGLNGAVLTV